MGARGRPRGARPRSHPGRRARGVRRRALTTHPWHHPGPPPAPRCARGSGASGRACSLSADDPWSVGGNV
ncbi:Exonuclease SbcC [Nocardioides sp. AX2bis]|nr:Exonuclease SbcC [Nocardioides sp. AX2bis]